MIVTEVPTIAVVDDDDSVRSALDNLLRSVGLAVTTFGSAEDFLASPAVRAVACLVADVQMPGMSGLDAVKALKGWDETKNIPTMALSAAATKNDIDKGLAAGFDRYLTKPVLVSEVTEALRKAMV